MREVFPAIALNCTKKYSKTGGTQQNTSHQYVRKNSGFDARLIFVPGSARNNWALPYNI